MATVVRLEFLSSGFQQVLESAQVAKWVTDETEDIARSAGDGMKAEVFMARYGGSPRPVGVVATDTIEAMQAEAESGVLSRAVHGRMR